jgi:hypothetical protein
MAVTDVMGERDRDPIPERGPEERPLSRGLPCLVCGEWIEADAKDAFRVVISNPPREAEYACHEACLASVKHPSVPLPL